MDEESDIAARAPDGDVAKLLKQVVEKLLP